ncbi:MAG: hypothetical protein GY737_14095 [Desulfobacteraceae bacterium]|nr:hypothetical protein [Desulfobacteraceae bacterium]
MQELTKSQRARLAIREFKVITDSLAIRGFYRPSGRLGKALEGCLRDLSPEIYGTMNDSRVVELKGLEYVIDRLPQGIEESTKIILTDEDQFDETPFKAIEPLKRRRTSYRINDRELCFIISRGISEIYDIITHMVFLNIEAKKIYKRIQDDYGNPRMEWKELERVVNKKGELSVSDLDSALWNLSIILGRPYHETRESYESLERKRKENKSNNGLFSLIYSLGRRIENEHQSKDEALVIYFTPSLMKIIGHHHYGKIWASDIKALLVELGLEARPFHIISANLHSVVNLIYGFSAMKEAGNQLDDTDFYRFLGGLRDKSEMVLDHAEDHGLVSLPDRSGANIDCQVIDTAKLEGVAFHPDFGVDPGKANDEKPVILVMDYAFGAQAFELMENLVKPLSIGDEASLFNLGSISIMGKAGILSGETGDIMLATAHVCEGTSDNYIVENDLVPGDFDGEIAVCEGPMATVLGTSLQNRDVLEMFLSDWRAVGLEMEGGHYQKAISAAIIKGFIPKGTRTRYAYYASDNPLMTGNTLAAGAMGEEGVKPTYMITKVILQKIFGPTSF